MKIRILIRMVFIKMGVLIGLGALIGIGALINKHIRRGALIRRRALNRIITVGKVAERFILLPCLLLFRPLFSRK